MQSLNTSKVQAMFNPLNLHLNLKNCSFYIACIIFSLLQSAFAGSPFKQQKLLANDRAPEDFFSFSVAISGNTTLIGSFKTDDKVNGVDAGSAYVFTRNENEWEQQVKLTALDGAADDRFGRSVALSGDTALITVMRKDDKSKNSGSAYLFTRKGNIWNHLTTVTANDGSPGNLFGWIAALSDSNALVGATRNDDKGSESGSAYVIEIRQN